MLRRTDHLRIDVFCAAAEELMIFGSRKVSHLVSRLWLGLWLGFGLFSMSLLVGPVSTGALLFDFWRPITLLSPKNMPGTHQYAVTLVPRFVPQIVGLFSKSLLVDKVSWYMKCFLILPYKYCTFVTSPFLSPSPSPAPFVRFLNAQTG